MSLNNILNLLRKSMSSWTYDGNCSSKPLMCQSTNFEIISVGHPLLLMIGLPGFPSLQIFGRM